MFGRKSVEHAEAPLEGSNEPANERSSLGQRNTFVNFAFQNSPIDEEPDTLELGETRNDEFDLAKILKPSSLPQTGQEPSSIPGSSTKCELQTVVRWENLVVEVTVQGETKRILDNISGQTNNLEILAILGKHVRAIC